MNKIIDEYKRNGQGFYHHPSYGDGYRCSAYLTDGTYLPCVILYETKPFVDLAIRRFAEEKKKGKASYRDVVEGFLLRGNRIVDWNIARLEPCKYAFPNELLDQLTGETAMGYTSFALEMNDGKCFQFGTSFHVEFFDVPDGYTFGDVKKLYNNSFVSSRGKVKSRLEAGKSCRKTRTYREKPYFICYPDFI